MILAPYNAHDGTGFASVETSTSGGSNKCLRAHAINHKRAWRSHKYRLVEADFIPSFTIVDKTPHSRVAIRCLLVHEEQCTWPSKCTRVEPTFRKKRSSLKTHMSSLTLRLLCLPTTFGIVFASLTIGSAIFATGIKNLLLYRVIMSSFTLCGCDGLAFAGRACSCKRNRI